MLSMCRKSVSPSNFISRLYNREAHISSESIRSRFIEYFVNENDHTFVRSSPLKPINDETIPFVNAGMVQFKSVLQGHHLPPAARVANSQKCARVGGKHNDLDIVGSDGYHHTFFEMLGNWSFGSCNKEESCKMAWELLTGPYGLDPNRLYVTYFEGDAQTGVKADFETREIWRQLGLKESHILPFGAKDNFWEMGLVGPCGPCTEIHVDHEPNRSDAASRVNAGFADLTEIWNLVFIQFNRNSDGSLSQLKQSHVDTGMGFERLVALLNGAKSNYDTDLFTPMMNSIQKISGFPAYSFSFDPKDETFVKDQAYRVLCDHSRLITVALADGVHPQNECKLRWVLRRALNISHDKMGMDEKLLLELSNYVAESLHNIYPEVGKKLPLVKRIIQDEAEIYSSLKQDYPKIWLQLIQENPEVEDLLEFGSNRGALAAAFKKMKGCKSEVPASLAFHMFESHGMDAQLIGEMAKIQGKIFSVGAFQQEMKRARDESKLLTALGKTVEGIAELLASAQIPKTCDSFKYTYDPKDNGYTFPPVSAKVVALVENGKLKSQVSGGTECGVVLDRTNFYHTAGGQSSDVGQILISSSKYQKSVFVKNVTKVGDYVVHFSDVNGTLRVGDEVVTKIDAQNRTACMQNHTLAHLINGQMQILFDAAVQEKCVVQPSFLKLTYSLHGQELKAEDVRQMEEAIQNSIEDKLHVNRYTVNAWQIPPGTTFLSDETYPVDNINIIDVKSGKKILSREACCGTHLLNTHDIGKFCIAEVIKSKKVCVCAVTGAEAEMALANSQKLKRDVNNFMRDVNELERSALDLDSEEGSLKPMFDKVTAVSKSYSQIRKFIHDNQRRFSFVTYDSGSACLEDSFVKIQNAARFITELEVKKQAKKSKFVVHCLKMSEHLGKVPLGKYTRLVSNPIMLFALQDKELKVRCVIPQELVSENFNAVVWMEEALSHLIEADEDGRVVSHKKDGQTIRMQSRLVEFNNKVPKVLRKKRCQKASEAAWQFALSRTKVKYVKKAKGSDD